MASAAAKTRQLWDAYSATRDQTARDALLRHLIPLVRKLAPRIASKQGFLGSHDEVFTVGLDALQAAIKSYDPTKGASLETYVGSKIRWLLIDEIRRRGWFGRRARARGVGVVSVDFGKIERLLIGVDQCGSQVYLNVAMSCPIPLPVHAFIREPHIEKDLETQDLLQYILERLRPDDRGLLVEYFIEEKTLGEIGQERGITAGRVHQCLQRVLAQAQRIAKHISGRVGKDASWPKGNRGRTKKPKRSRSSSKRASRASKSRKR